MGPPKEQSGARRARPKQKQSLVAETLFCFGVCSCCCFASARTMRAALGPHRMAAAEAAMPAGAARWIAPIPRLAQGCAIRGTQAAEHRPRNTGRGTQAADADPQRRMRGGRHALGRVLLVIFLARARKVTRAAEGRAKAFAPKRVRTGLHTAPAVCPPGHSLRECSLRHPALRNPASLE